MSHYSLTRRGCSRSRLHRPLHVAFAWWYALARRPEHLDELHWLTYHPAAFGDYSWAEEMMDGLSLATKVHFAVDDPTASIAFVRFVPGFDQTVQVVGPVRIAGAVFLALVRTDDLT